MEQLSRISRTTNPPYALKVLQLSAFHTVFVVLSSYNQAVRQFLWADICVGGVSHAGSKGLA